MNEYDIKPNLNEFLIEKTRFLRNKALRKKKVYSKERLERPITFWTKEDRLINEIGKEFTIILRTRGCKWALGETGGCSMCGYVQDANVENVESNQIIKQFDYAFQEKLSEIEDDNKHYVIKLFNSGSFFDDDEIAQNARSYIYEKISDVKNIKEVVVESRIEYINSEVLIEMRNNLKNKYIEIGIGLETTNDYIRNNFINKGLLFNEFQNTFQLCKEHNIGIKSYLLFKPPFLNEIGAIDDCADSIKALIKLNINSISINPVNIQRGSLTEYLWYQNRYRSPWFYSLIKCLKKALTKEDLVKTRILTDPSGAGTKRGIHNCLKRECNENMVQILKNFVFHQDLDYLSQKDYNCECKKKYHLQKHFV